MINQTEVTAPQATAGHHSSTKATTTYCGGFSKKVSQVAAEIRKTAPHLTTYQSHQIAGDIQRFYIRHRHSDGTGKAWSCNMIRERYGWNATRILTSTGLFECTVWTYPGRQRRWTLTKEGERIAQLFFDEEDPEQIFNEPLEPSKKPQKRRGRPRSRSVQSHDKNGSRAKARPHITTTPAVNIDHIKASLNRTDLKPETRAQLHAALNGEVEYQYRETSTGRLQGQKIHWQGFTKQAKQICFPDCTELDIKNCHPCIIAQLAHRHGIQTPAINDYLQNREYWRQRIAQQHSIAVDEAKAVLIARYYGASKGTHSKTTLAKQFGREKAKQILNDPMIRATDTDVRNVTQAVVKKARKEANHRGNIINASGKPIHRKAKPKQIMAHIVQGLESNLMHAVVEEIGCEVQVWTHDGVMITEEISPTQKKSIQREVQKRTGFGITLDMKALDAGFKAVQSGRANRALNGSILSPFEEEGREEEKEEGQEEGEEEGAIIEKYSDKPLFYIDIEVLNYCTVQPKNNAEKWTKTDDSKQSTERGTGPPH